MKVHQSQLELQIQPKRNLPGKYGPHLPAPHADVGTTKGVGGRRNRITCRDFTVRLRTPFPGRV